MKRTNRKVIEATINNGGYIIYNSLDAKPVLYDIKNNLIGTINFETFMKIGKTLNKRYDTNYREVYFKKSYNEINDILEDVATDERCEMVKVVEKCKTGLGDSPIFKEAIKALEAIRLALRYNQIKITLNQLKIVKSIFLAIEKDEYANLIEKMIDRVS